MISTMLRARGAFRDINDFESFTILGVTATYTLISNPNKAHRVRLEGNHFLVCCLCSTWGKNTFACVSPGKVTMAESSRLLTSVNVLLPFIHPPILFSLYASLSTFYRCICLSSLCNFIYKQSVLFTKGNQGKDLNYNLSHNFSDRPKSFAFL